jgi:hypothetical protein
LFELTHEVTLATSLLAAVMVNEAPLWKRQKLNERTKLAICVLLIVR